MKILLDESLPLKLIDEFPIDFQVFTVKGMGWLGLKNGELMRNISDSNFDLFVTVDKNLPYQQNLEKISFSIAILEAYNNRLPTLRAIIPKLINVIQMGRLSKVTRIS